MSLIDIVRLTHEETEFLRRARIELLVPIASVAGRTEAMLVLGAKRSEEPYSREDQDLLVAITSSLALLSKNPRVPRQHAPTFSRSVPSAVPATTVGLRSACKKVHA